MDVLVPILIVVVVLVAAATLFNRSRGGGESGIARRPAPGAASGSAQDGAGGSDREAFDREVGDRGTR